MPKIPVGVKNRNYLNVKNNKSDPWMDGGGLRSKTDGAGHAVFTDVAYGVRAGLLTLRTYFLTHKLQSVLDILSRWAPASDTIGSQPGNAANNPTEYAIFVSNRMGVNFQQKLELFHDDKTINNVGQLRGLFYAMAAFEVGGDFQVPDKEFNAGLELLEPGITKTGTGPSQPQAAVAVASPVTPATTPAPAAGATTAPATPSPTATWKIVGSVGRADKEARNDRADVETVQTMLRHAAMILENPAIDPGSLDGAIDPKASKSETVRAITAFQSRFLTKPDGVIEPDGRSWRELVLVVGGTTAASTTPAASGNEYFPFTKLPAEDWTSSPRRFAANRSGNRAHAGCDLYFPEGTVIHAIADGTVVRGPYFFYAETYALEIDHGSFIARYGEIQKQAMVREGDRVVAGQSIARVGHLIGISVPSDMLHLELYDKTAHGPLTVPAENSAIAPNGRPFLRRKDLIDPTPKLNVWQHNLPGAPAPLAIAITPPSTPVAEPLSVAFASTPTAVPQTGFCIYIHRIRQELRAGKDHARTVADYQCFWNGAAINDLGGQIVERQGPGDNSSSGVTNHRRIEAATYPLWVHDGTRYSTHHYDKAGGFPLPGLRLMNTGKRTDILIHPCHHSDGYVSSIGCLNPATGLKDADSRVNLPDSRARVIAIVEALKAKYGNQFPKKEAPIPDAVVIIVGEP